MRELGRVSWGKKGLIQSLWDIIGIPFRFLLFDQEWLPKLHWTTLEEERLRAVFPHIHGRLLDIGAGKNTLVKVYSNGIGVDVYEWGGGAMVVENTSTLPFDDGSFDTITLVACLNHIPYREEMLKEAHRTLKPGGRLIITMIDPFLGEIGHALWWYSEDKKRGGMAEGEVGGMWSGEIFRLCQQAGFLIRTHRRFQLWMNNIYIFEAA